MLSVSQLEIKGELEECVGINIVLGANNSGKSTFLREVNDAAYSLNVHPSTERYWVGNLSIKREDTRTYAERILPGTFKRPYDPQQRLRSADFTGFKENIADNNNYTPTVYEMLRSASDEAVTYSTVRQESFPNTNEDQLNVLLSNMAVSMETTANRLTANFSTTINDVGISPAQDMMHYLLTHPDKLKEINTYVKKVFRFEITFDNLQQGNKWLRIKPDEAIKGAPNLKETADKWNASAPFVGNQGDGIRAYLKILFCLLEPSNDIICIDEPETFLHPPHRRELGRLVASLAKEHNKQVFVATHDSEFLGGLMSTSPKDAKVFYLSRTSAISKCSTYSLSEINKITVRASNFVSERILQSFFYQKTILTENENDRTFYEIAAVDYFPDRVQDINFVGLNGKGDVIKIHKKLNSLGLRCGFILDFDFLLDADSPYSDTEVGIEHNSFRAKLQSAIAKKAVNRDEAKHTGLIYFSSVNKQLYSHAQKVVELYAKQDMYIVPNGELESFTGGSSNLGDAIPFIQERRRTSLASFLKLVLTI